MTDDSVLSSLQAVAGTRYNRSEYNKDILDTYLLHKAREQGIRLPTGGDPDEYKFLGAFVEDTTAGMNENVVYCDLASLYPSNILSLNASPETIVGTQEELEASQYTEDDCVWGYIDPRPVKHLDKGTPKSEWKQYTNGQYKMVYDPHQTNIKWTCDEADGPQYERLYFLRHDVQKGFLTNCVNDLIQLKELYRGTPLYGATKQVVNSVYGIVGTAREGSSERLFDWRLAEAITLTGRKIIKGSRDYLLDELHDRGYDDAYACSGDTDATAISLPSVATNDEALRVVGDVVEQLNNKGYDGLMQETFGVPPEYRQTEIEIESFAPRLFIPADDSAPGYPHTDVGVKKRYIQWETWNDDDGYCDDISITGLEEQRSDSMPVIQEAQRLFAETLRMDTSEAKEWLFPQLRELAESVQTGDIALSRVCKRGGIGQDLSEYGTASRRAGPLYRGAKYANQHIDGVTVQHGDKPARIHIERVPEGYPSTYDTDTAEDGDVVDAVALPNPENLPEGFVVNYEQHWRDFKSSMKPLLETRGWPWQDILSSTEQDTLQSFAISD